MPATLIAVKLYFGYPSVLNNKVIIQWGGQLFRATGTTATFPVAFTSKNWKIAFSPKGVSTSVTVGATLTDITKTTFTAHGWNVSGLYDYTILWIAVGY